MFCLVFAVLFNYSNQFVFLRTIEAVGFPYYKLLMSLGDCKGNKFVYKYYLYRVGLFVNLTKIFVYFCRIYFVF